MTAQETADRAKAAAEKIFDCLPDDIPISLTALSGVVAAYIVGTGDAVKARDIFDDMVTQAMVDIAHAP